MTYLDKGVLNEINSVSEFKFKNKHNVSIFPLYINSIHKHFDELVIYLSSNKELFDSVIQTETCFLTNFNLPKLILLELI